MEQYGILRCISNLHIINDNRCYCSKSGNGTKGRVDIY